MLLPPLVTNYSTPKHSPIFVLNEESIKACRKLVCELIKAEGGTDIVHNFDWIINVLGIHFSFSVHLNRCFKKIPLKLWLKWRDVLSFCLLIVMSTASQIHFQIISFSLWHICRQAQFVWWKCLKGIGCCYPFLFLLIW